jgi:hypothetical protein
MIAEIEILLDLGALTPSPTDANPRDIGDRCSPRSAPDAPFVLAGDAAAARR